MSGSHTETSRQTPDSVSLVGGNTPAPKILWADTPYRLIDTTRAESKLDIPEDHFCREMAYLMSQIHNTILRGLNAVYNQALGVQRHGSKKDIAHFLVYNQCMFEFLHHHHDNEEDIFFPQLVKLAGDNHLFDLELDEHKQFTAGAEEYKKYIYGVRPEEFEGEKLVKLIEAFGDILHKHLVSEVEMLLSMSKYDSDACKQAWNSTGVRAMNELSPLRHLPLILGCQDKTFTLDGKTTLFPVEATTFQYYLANYVFSWRHAGAWRFAPADIFGKPRPLAFVAAS